MLCLFGLHIQDPFLRLWVGMGKVGGFALLLFCGGQCISGGGRLWRWMLFMIPMGLIVLVAIGYVWRTFRWGGGCCGSGHYGNYHAYSERENAMEILRQRYARGKISKEQYEQMKKDILA
jgi:putative membrane protein